MPEQTTPAQLGENRSTSYVILGVNVAILGAAVFWVIHKANHPYETPTKVRENTIYQITELPQGATWKWIGEQRIAFDTTGEPLGYMRYNNPETERASHAKNQWAYGTLTEEEQASPLKFYPARFNSKEGLELKVRHERILDEEKRFGINR